MFGLDLEVLVGEGLALGADVPLSQPNPHSVQRGGVDAVTRRDDPPLGDEGAAAADPLAQETLFDHGHLPGVAAELGVLAAHDAVATRIHLAAF